MAVRAVVVARFFPLPFVINSFDQIVFIATVSHRAPLSDVQHFARTAFVFVADPAFSTLVTSVASSPESSSRN